MITPDTLSKLSTELRQARFRMAAQGVSNREFSLAMIFMGLGGLTADATDEEITGWLREIADDFRAEVFGVRDLH